MAKLFDELAAIASPAFADGRAPLPTHVRGLLRQTYALAGFTRARIEVCRTQMRSDSHVAVAHGVRDLHRVLSALCDIAPLAT
jgi:uncharacterized protein (DUF934 family)